MILSKQGKPANLYELMTENSKGRLVLDPRVANFDKAKFVAKLHGMMKRTNQLKVTLIGCKHSAVHLVSC